MPTKRPDWLRDRVSFSIYKAAEGGMGFKMAKEILAEHDIPCRPDYSPYVGQEGLCVPKKHERKVRELLFGPE